jgi:Ran GTPase-activating protein (RanGAP) involved in mRNA processing and transport
LGGIPKSCAQLRRCLDPDERVNVGEIMSDVLGNMVNLQNLDFSCNGIAIDDMDCIALGTALQRLKKLRRVLLHDNDVGSNGAAALATTFAGAKNLLEINLDRNPLGDGGAEAIAQLLKVNPSVRNVEMLETGMSWVGAQALIDALPDSDPMRCFKLYKMCRLIVTAAQMRHGHI